MLLLDLHVQNPDISRLQIAPSIEVKRLLGRKNVNAEAHVRARTKHLRVQKRTLRAHTCTHKSRTKEQKIKVELEASGKPSTWFPPGILVELIEANDLLD